MREAVNLKAPLTIFAGLQVADLVTTWHALAAGGVEANPLGRALLATNFGYLVLVKLALTALSVVAAVVLARRGPRQYRWAVVGVCLLGLFYCAVVGSNLIQLKLYA